MEEKAERNLIRLCEEKKRQQKELYELKRKLLLKEREQQLDEILDKQVRQLYFVIPWQFTGTPTRHIPEMVICL